MHVNNLFELNHDVFYGACDTYDLLILVVVPSSISYKQLVNHVSIIQLDAYMYSFCYHGVFIRKMKLAVNLVNNKVVNNLFIYLVLKFHGYMPGALRIIACRNLLSDLLILGTDLKD